MSNIKVNSMSNIKVNSISNISNERKYFIVFIRLYTNIQKEPIIFKFKNISSNKYGITNKEQNFATFSTTTYELPFRIEELLEILFNDNQFYNFYYKRVKPYQENNKDIDKTITTSKKYYIDDSKIKNIIEEKIQKQKYIFKDLDDIYKQDIIKVDNNVNKFIDFNKGNKLLDNKKVIENTKKQQEILEQLYLSKKDIYNIKSYSWDNKIYTSNLIIDGFYNNDNTEDLFIFNRREKKDIQERNTKLENIKDRIRASLMISHSNRIKNIDNYTYIDIIEQDNFVSYKNDDDKIIYYISKLPQDDKYLSILDSYFSDYKIIKLTSKNISKIKDDNDKIKIKIDNSNFYINKPQTKILENKDFTQQQIIRLIKEQFNFNEKNRYEKIYIDNNYFMEHMSNELLESDMKHNNNYTIYMLSKSSKDRTKKTKITDLKQVFIIFNIDNYIPIIVKGIKDGTYTCKNCDSNRITSTSIEKILKNDIMENVKDVVKEALTGNIKDKTYKYITEFITLEGNKVYKDYNVIIDTNDKLNLYDDKKYYTKYEINVELFLERNPDLEKDSSGNIININNNKSLKNANCKYHKYQLLRIIDNVKDNFKIEKNKKKDKMIGGYNKKNSNSYIYNNMNNKHTRRTKRKVARKMSRKVARKMSRKPSRKVARKMSRKVARKQMNRRHRRTMKKGGFGMSDLKNMVNVAKKQGQKAVEVAQKSVQIAKEQGQKAVQQAQKGVQLAKEQSKKGIQAAHIVANNIKDVTPSLNSFGNTLQTGINMFTK
jgi:hypothetical protein